MRDLGGGELHREKGETSKYSRRDFVKPGKKKIVAMGERKLTRKKKTNTPGKKERWGRS